MNEYRPFYISIKVEFLTKTGDHSFGAHADNMDHYR